MRYFELMVSNPQPQFEQYIGRIVSGLIKAENQEALNILLKIPKFDEDGWVFKLVPINAGIINNVIITASQNGQIEKAILFWQANKVKFKPYLINGFFFHVMYLNLALYKIGYYDFCSDIFKNDTEGTQNFLSKIQTRGSFVRKLLTSIENLSEDHKIIINKFRKEQHSGQINNEVVYPFIDRKTKVEFELNDEIIMGKYFIWSKEETFGRVLKNLNRNGIFLSSKLSWRRLSQFFGYIVKHIEKVHSERSLGVSVCEKIINKILSFSKALQFATNDEISYLLTHIGKIDKEGLYERVMSEEHFKTDMHMRLRNIRFDNGTIYLAGHLYPAGIWEKVDLENKIKNADDEEKSIMRTLVEKITSQDSYEFDSNSFMGFLQLNPQFCKMNQSWEYDEYGNKIPQSIIVGEPDKEKEPYSGFFE